MAFLSVGASCCEHIRTNRLRYSTGIIGYYGYLLIEAASIHAMTRLPS